MAQKKQVKTAVKRTINPNISVKLASLTKPIEVKTIKRGTTLKEFLEANQLTYSSNIRVNAQATTANYKLKAGDIICVVTQVSGG